MVVGDDVAAPVDDDAGALRALALAGGLDGDDRIGDGGGNFGELPGGLLGLSVGLQRHLRGGEGLDDLGGLAADDAAETPMTSATMARTRQRDPGHPAAEQHVADAELAHRGRGGDGRRLWAARGTRG